MDCGQDLGSAEQSDETSTLEQPLPGGALLAGAGGWICRGMPVVLTSHDILFAGLCMRVVRDASRRWQCQVDLLIRRGSDAREIAEKESPAASDLRFIERAEVRCQRRRWLEQAETLSWSRAPFSARRRPGALVEDSPRPSHSLTASTQGEACPNFSHTETTAEPRCGRAVGRSRRARRAGTAGRRTTPPESA